MNKLQHIIILLLIPMNSYGWGVPATATTTIEARVTNWTENPCDYGTRFQEACDYAMQHNLFAAQPTIPQGGWENVPAPVPQDNITNYE